MQTKYAAIKGFIALCIAFLISHQAKSAQRVQPKGFVQHAYVKLNAFLIKHFAEHDKSVKHQNVDFLHYTIQADTTKKNLTVQQSKDNQIGNYTEKIKKENALLDQYTLRSAIKNPHFWGLAWMQASAIFFYPNVKDQPFNRQAYLFAGSYAVAALGNIAFRQFVLKPIAEINCAQNKAFFNQKIQEIEGYEYNPDKYKPAE